MSLCEISSTFPWAFFAQKKGCPPQIITDRSTGQQETCTADATDRRISQLLQAPFWWPRIYLPVVIPSDVEPMRVRTHNTRVNMTLSCDRALSRLWVTFHQKRSCERVYTHFIRWFCFCRTYGERDSFLLWWTWAVVRKIYLMIFLSTFRICGDW